MRPSLNNIEFIEDYLLGNLDPAENTEAKQRIDGSPELSQLLETQRSIYSAARRRALRNEIASYAPAQKLNFFQKYRNWFIGGISVFVGLIGLLIFTNSNNLSTRSQQESSALPAHFQHTDQMQDVKPWIPFDVQTFSFTAEKGTTIVGDQGTLIILAKNSLIDKNGKRVTGVVEAQLIEALDWEDMIAYNLTTTSTGKALSSGGMMRIRYWKEGEEVFVDPVQPMLIEIPTNEYNPEMSVWEGEVKDGQLDWKHLQEIEHYLNKVDLKDLDFIPTGFDAAVSALLPYRNHNVVSNRLVDSLYYSMSASRDNYDVDKGTKDYFVQDCYFDIPVRNDIGKPFQRKPQMQGNNSVTAQIVDSEGNPIAGMDVKLRMDRYLEHKNPITTDENGYFSFDQFYPGEVAIYASLHSQDDAEILWKYCLESSFVCPKSPKNFTLKKPLVAEYSRMINFKKLSVSPQTGGCFIDPIAIKTLKTSRFKHTFIATKEFESRLRAMHSMKDGSLLLETYVNNLTKPLWKCDQAAAQLLSGKEKEIFEAFASQRLTNIKNTGIHQEALRNYYSEQRKAYQQEKQQQLRAYQAKTTEELIALRRNLRTTLESPMKLAKLTAQSKGRDKTRGQSAHTSSRDEKRGKSAGNASYKFMWYSNAWCNIDRFLKEIGANPYSTAISIRSEDETTKVYQCVRKLKNVIGLSREPDGYTAFTSRTDSPSPTHCLALAMNGTQLLFDVQSYSPSKDRNVKLRPVPISAEDFYLKLCSLAPLESSVADRIKLEQETLEGQLRVMERQATLMNTIDKAVNQISEELVIYNYLFDALDCCNKPNG